MPHNNKEKYELFCQNNFIPLYSRPWWMDAVCEPHNWDVWIYDNCGVAQAAMPYYIQVGCGRRCITKAPLTQSNGIIFSYPVGSKSTTKAVFEEKVINAACQFIKSMNLDIYEQQYQTSFTNWLPFFWNHYSAIARYTYVIENTDDLKAVWSNVSSKRRSVIKKGRKNSTYSDTVLTIDSFYQEHKKIYFKQGLECPFSYELWRRVAEACMDNSCGKFSCRLADDGNVAAVSFVAWDDKCLYKLMGGPIPEYAKIDAYSALTWDEIELAHNLNVAYDFEGSVIKRISKSFREYGAVPKQYFKIRRVFNPTVIREEAEYSIKVLEGER